MSEPLQASKNRPKNPILRGILLIALGVFIGLTVHRGLRMIRHEVTLQISLPREMNQRLEVLEMGVRDPGKGDEVMAFIQFRMPETRDPDKNWVHTLSLPRGTYQLEFFLQSSGSARVRALRILEVTGSESIRIHLP